MTYDVWMLLFPNAALGSVRFGAVFRNRPWMIPDSTWIVYANKCHQEQLIGNLVWTRSWKRIFLGRQLVKSPGLNQSIIPYTYYTRTPLIGR